MRKTKLRIALVFSSAVLLAILGYAWHLYENVETYVHPELIPPDYYWLENKDQIYTKTGIVAIAGREFEIPISYVDGRFKNGRMENDVVLQYVLPDFKSRLEFPSKEKRRELRLDGFMAGMLLEEASVRPTLDQQVENHRYKKTSEISKSSYGNLVKEVLYHHHGHAPTFDQELYLAYSDEGKINDYIRCSTSGSVPIPSCSHKFIDKGLVYRIRYNRTRYLTKWQEQRAAAIAFIDSFEISTKKRD